MLPNDRNDNTQTGIRMVHAGSRQLFRYWEGLRAERASPTREEIELSKISSILPNITVIEEEQQRFWHHRMAGSTVCELLGEQVTSRDALRGFDRADRDALLDLLQIATGTQQPVIMRLRLIGQYHVLPAEMLALPVRDVRKNKVQLFCGLFGFGSEAMVNWEPLLRRELISARLILTEHGAEQANPSVHETPHLHLIQGGLSH